MKIIAVLPLILLLGLLAVACGTEPPPPPPVTATTPPEVAETPPLPPTATREPNRASCGAIRGTAYLSQTERAWFLANCQTPPTVPPPTVNNGTCHPSYQGGSDAARGGCIRSGVGDYDCTRSANGPNYVSGSTRVVGSDPFDLDADNDGIGCE
jgi:hypothetical protein